MDSKCQRAVLLAMRMNSAHKRALRVSPNSAADLEMFARVSVIAFDDFFHARKYIGFRVPNCAPHDSKYELNAVGVSAVNECVSFFFQRVRVASCV